MSQQYIIINKSTLLFEMLGANSDKVRQILTTW